jgi:hypothetical protein
VGMGMIVQKSFLQLCVWEWFQCLLTVKISLLQNIAQGLGMLTDFLDHYISQTALSDSKRDMNFISIHIDLYVR